MSITGKLSAAITVWLSEKESRTLKILARLSKVSYATVRRAAQGEGETSQEVALKIAQIVMKDHEYRAFAEEHAPGLKRYWADVATKPEEDMMEFLDDERYIPVILLAGHQDGTNEKEVQELFGRDAVRYFNDLVNSGHMVRLGSNWRLEKDVGSLNLDTARMWLSKFTQICPIENDFLHRVSAAHVGWESVSISTAIQLFRLTCEYMRSAHELVSKDENKGEILVFFGSLFNVLKNGEKLQ